MSRRILFVLRYHYLRYTGGAEMQAAMIARELAKRGWDVHYASETAALPETNPLDGVTLHALPENPSYWKGNRTPLRELIIDLKPNVVYTRTFDPYIGYVVKDKPPESMVIWAAAADGDVRAWPYLMQGWRTLPLWLFLKRFPVYAYQNSIARRGRAGADIVLVQHRDQQDRLTKLGIHSELLRNSHPPVPESDVQKHAGVPVITWVDSIRSRKRPELFLELVQRCRDLDAQFVMIGYVHEPRYSELIEVTKRIAPNFRYDGFIPLNIVNHYFRAAHVHVKTALPVEGFPNTFIQAWMHGVPVVSLDTDPEQLIRARGLGSFCNDLSALEQAVRELARNSDRRREIGQRARAFAIDEFDLQKNIDRLERLIETRQ